jgi:hypothetical protein
MWWFIPEKSHSSVRNVETGEKLNANSHFQNPGFITSIYHFKALSNKSCLKDTEYFI